MELKNVLRTFVPMRGFIKVISIILIFISTSIAMDSCKSRGPYNPYRKMKIKPNESQMRADKKIIKQQNRLYKRQLGNSRKSIFGRRKAPGT